MIRRSRLVAGTSAALLVSLVGGATVLLFAEPSPQSPAALRPVPSTAAAPEPSVAAPQPDSSSPTVSDSSSPTVSDSSSPTVDLYDGFTSTPADTGVASVDAGALFNQGGLPGGASPAALPPAPQLPVFQFPAPPALPAAPTIDWQAALQPYLQSQLNAAAVNLAGSITGTAVGSASGALSSVGVAAGDLVLIANYLNETNPALLAQLQNAAPAAAAALQSGVAPDFSGLSSAFAAAAAQPPLGVPAPPQLPQLPPPPNLPTPEQVAAALAVPAVGIPALAVPALPPPPIGLPSIGLPSIGLPSIGLPSFEVPSITRLLGLPF